MFHESLITIGSLTRAKIHPPIFFLELISESFWYAPLMAIAYIYCVVILCESVSKIDYQPMIDGKYF